MSQSLLFKTLHVSRIQKGSAIAVKKICFCLLSAIKCDSWMYFGVKAFVGIDFDQYTKMGSFLGQNRRKIANALTAHSFRKPHLDQDQLRDANTV